MLFSVVRPSRQQEINQFPIMLSMVFGRIHFDLFNTGPLLQRTEKNMFGVYLVYGEETFITKPAICKFRRISH